MAAITATLLSAVVAAAQGVPTPVARDIDVRCDKGETVQDAIDRASIGTTITILGVCDENVVIRPPKTGLTIRGGDTGAGITGVISNRAVVDIRSATGINIRGLLIIGPGTADGPSTDFGGEGIALFDGASANISDCVVENNRSHGISVNSSDAVLIRNAVRNNNLRDLHPVSGVGLVFNATAKFFNNLVERNSRAGVVLRAESNAFFSGDTIRDNQGDGIAIRQISLANLEGALVTVADNQAFGIACDADSRMSGAAGVSFVAIGNPSGDVVCPPPQGAVVRSLNGQTGTVTLAGTNGLSVSQGGGTVTVTSNATPANAAGTLVARDGSGSFAAGTIALAGNLELPNTSSDSGGVLTVGGAPFLHGSQPAGNTFVGPFAGNMSLTGGANTGAGASALQSNTTGILNSAFGVLALGANTTGSFNAAFGANALASSIGANNNTAFGINALTANTTGEENSAFGDNALFRNTEGRRNAAFGSSALNANTVGESNSAFGIAALRANTTGTFNAAFGGFALINNSEGDQNSAFGASALNFNTTGNDNAAFGVFALFNATGENNAAFGSCALCALTSGDSNTAIGFQAGASLTSGSNNIYVGNGGLSIESNTIRIGLGQTATFIAGISGATSATGVPVFVNSTGQLGTTTSSRRYKLAIDDMAKESDVLAKLRPVAFYYRPEYDDTQTRQYGLVAEEVAEVAPQLVTFGEDGAPQAVRYHFVNAMLLNEVQKQQRLVEEQRNTITGQQAEILELAARLARLEAVVNQYR